MDVQGETNSQYHKSGINANGKGFREPRHGSILESLVMT